MIDQDGVVCIGDKGVVYYVIGFRGVFDRGCQGCVIESGFVFKMFGNCDLVVVIFRVD